MSIRGITAPFYTYAVLANAVFQRGIFVLFLLDQGFSAAEVAVMQTLLYLVSGLVEIPTGWLGDRFGRRASIVLGQLLMAAGLAGQVILEGYPAFLVLFALHGVGMACVSGAETALLYDALIRRGARADYVRVRSRFTVLGTVTTGAAIALGGPLQLVSWEVVYFGSAACLTLSVVVMLVWVPEIRGVDAVDEEEDADGHAPAAPLRAWPALLGAVATPGLAALVVVSGLMHATLTPYFVFAQQTLADQGSGAGLVGVIVAAGFLVGGVAPLLSERAERRVGHRVLVPVTLLVLAAALGATGLGLLWVSVAVFLVAAAVPEVTAVLVDNVFHSSVPSRHRATLLSVFTFVESVLISCGYLALGVLMDKFGSGVGMAVYAAVPLAAALLWLPALRGTGARDSDGRAVQAGAG